MTISQRELVEQFGSIVEAGNGSIFVGAGMSVGAGFPAWSGLLEGLRAIADIPRDIDDMPLLAQYFEQNTEGGRDLLDAHILKALSIELPQSSEGHESLRRLPIDEYWTTNYDCLIEKFIPEASLITGDDQLGLASQLRRRRVIKLHGSLDSASPPGWAERPTITRGDYEKYENEHVRLWSALRASYLTKSLLFLGFSFSDPNIEILLRLSRLVERDWPTRHFTVIKKPDSDHEARRHELQVSDLEQSGVSVCAIESFDELPIILSRLVRRTRPKTLFVSGSKQELEGFSETCQRLGEELSKIDLSIASLAGEAAMEVSYSFGQMLKSEERYSPDRVLLYYRAKNEAPPALRERIGTVVYSEKEEDALRLQVMKECRAAVFVGGSSDRTRREIELAKSIGLPIIPIAHCGGQAREAHENTSASGAGFETNPDVERDWGLLASDKLGPAMLATARLVAHAMYLS